MAAANQAAQPAEDKTPVEPSAEPQPETPDAAATPDAGQAPASAKPSLVVLGAAVVLRTADGSDRYLYAGAPIVAAQFDKASIKHATSIGLIGKSK